TELHGYPHPVALRRLRKPNPIVPAVSAASASTCPWPARSYNAAMLDLKLLREQPEFVRERLALRGTDINGLFSLLKQKDELRRKLRGQVEQFQAKRNQLSKEIGGLIGRKELELAEVKKKEVEETKGKIQEFTQALAVLTTDLEDSILLDFPNIPHES